MIDPEVDRVLEAMRKRNPQLKDPKNKIVILAGDLTVLFMQGVRVGESIAKRKYMLDSKVKRVK